jgi:tRNA nucleotidyltransferase/poly(A) polymerase
MAKIYRVGGCIRDKFLGLDSKDIDFTFVLEDTKGFTVEDGFQIMTNWMTDQGFEIFLSTPDCFTIRAKFPKDHQFAGLVADFVMARKEVGYVEGTRRPILELGTLEDDLVRRDFTLNALAEDVDGNLIDLFGGVEDLKAGILRTPLDARVTMMDDPLRILRALRFSITKDFTISDDIWEAIKQPNILKKLEQTVSHERIREELLKMFQFNTPRTFRLLMDVDTFEAPGFLELIFKDGMWLQPTTKKI